MTVQTNMVALMRALNTQAISTKPVAAQHDGPMKLPLPPALGR
jgi:hypothetical protein